MGTGEVGQAAVLELGAEGLFEGIVHEGDLGILEDDGSIVIIRSATRPDAGEDHLGGVNHHAARFWHVDDIGGFEFADGVPSIGVRLAIGQYNAFVDQGKFLLGEIVKCPMNDNLGLGSVSVSGGIGRLGWYKLGLAGCLQEGKGAVASVGQVGGSRDAEQPTEIVLERLMDVLEVDEVEGLRLERGRGIVLGRSACHDLDEDELTLRVGISQGHGIVARAPPAARPDADLVGDRDRDLGLQRGEGMTSCGVRRVVGGDGTLADDFEVFSRGVVEESMHDDSSVGGIRRFAAKESVSGSSEVEVSCGGEGGEGRKSKGGELHGWKI